MYAKTAGQLIAELQELPPDTPVLLSGDAEGNDYSGLANVHEVYVRKEWSGGRHYDGVYDSQDIVDDPWNEGLELSEFRPVVALWPI